MLHFRFECSIWGKRRLKELFQADLVKIPQFFRFNDVDLCYRNNILPIGRMCQRVVNYLQPLKKALSALNLINFTGAINEYDPFQFSTHLHLINHIQHELMPIFDLSIGYKFRIHFLSNRFDGATVIASILQTSPIQQCLNVEIALCEIAHPIELPLEAISNFLHRKCTGINKNSVDRNLRINLQKFEIQNVRATCDHFKKVIRIF